LVALQRWRGLGTCRALNAGNEPEKPVALRDRLLLYRSAFAMAALSGIGPVPLAAQPLFQVFCELAGRAPASKMTRSNGATP
jgi:hypothetical protein